MSLQPYAVVVDQLEQQAAGRARQWAAVLYRADYLADTVVEGAL
ncbi:hypothetical protein WMF38_51015 [Sorangium sp. So ce118]